MIEVDKYHFSSIIEGEELSKEGCNEIEVLNPFTNEVIGKISCATPPDMANAVSSAHRVYTKIMKRMAAHKRAEILRKTADLLIIEANEFAHLLSLEAGKPIKESRVEVERAVQVLRFASEGASSIYRNLIPRDSVIGGENQIGMSKRVSLGVVAAITPFNLPLNLVLHKIAPAIAAGNTVVLKPAEKTPFTTLLLYRLFEKAGLPKGVFNIVLSPEKELVETLVTHPKVKRVTFSGSSAVGWEIQEMAKHKKVILELSSNAPNIIFEDADLDVAVTAIVIGGFTYAGQAFVSVQRVYVQETVYQAFLGKLTSKVKALKIGDPLDEATDVGPMITQEAAKLAESWVKEAIEQGATLLVGGNRKGNLMEPTIISDMAPDIKVVFSEVRAPIVSVMPFTTEEVVDHVNSSDFISHAGIFTADINRAMRMADVLETEDVWINEVAVRRYDYLPYGGGKSSSTGKEGIIYAIEEMTDIKCIGIKLH